MELFGDIIHRTGTRFDRGTSGRASEPRQLVRLLRGRFAQREIDEGEGVCCSRARLRFSPPRKVEKGTENSPGMALPVPVA